MKNCPANRNRWTARTGLLACLLAAAVLLSGCASADLAKFQNQVHHWVPVGTPVAEAQKIMEKHHFDCIIRDKQPDTPLKDATLSCTRQPGMFSTFGDWVAEFVIQDGVVADYGYIDL